MKKLLIVVDMQKDFVDGALGSKEAVAIVDNVVRKIETFDGDILVTYDTHGENYMQTQEGKNLPVPHCIKGTDGWKLDAKVQAAVEKRGCCKAPSSSLSISGYCARTRARKSPRIFI